MRGLIDTDGTVEKLGTMVYSTSSKRLCDDFVRLARSLGAYAAVNSKIPGYKYKGEMRKGQRSYNIIVSCNHYGDFVTIPHKKARVNKKQKNNNLNIESIERD